MTHSSEKGVGRLTSFLANFVVSDLLLMLHGTVNICIFGDECTDENEFIVKSKTDSSLVSTAFTAEGPENPA